MRVGTWVARWSLILGQFVVYSYIFLCFELSQMTCQLVSWHCEVLQNSPDVTKYSLTSVIRNRPDSRLPLEMSTRCPHLSFSDRAFWVYSRWPSPFWTPNSRKYYFGKTCLGTPDMYRATWPWAQWAQKIIVLGILHPLSYSFLFSFILTLCRYFFEVLGIKKSFREDIGIYIFCLDLCSLIYNIECLDQIIF